MKKIGNIIVVLLVIIVITGCGKSKDISINDSVTKIHALGDLVTYETYFHNVAKLDKEKDKGLISLLQKDRKLWIEYTGIVRLGVDMSKVKINMKGNNQVEVFIPKAKIIGKPDLDDKDFNEKSFIDSEDGIVPNKLTADDSRDAMALAQNLMAEKVQNDSNLLKTAQLRAKNLVEEYINQFADDNESYNFIWNYEE